MSILPLHDRSSTPRSISRWSLPLKVAGGAVAFVLTMGLDVHAQERPFALTARQTLLYDSNVLRLPSGAVPPAGTGLSSRGDSISTTTLRAEYGNVFGSQDVSAFAEVSAIRFRNFENRDATGYALGARWTGELDRAWFVAADASSNRFLTALVNQAGIERNLRTVNVVGATLGRRLTTDWSLIGRIDLTDVQNSADVLLASDRRSTGYELGVRYQPLSGIDGDLVVRRVNGASPRAQAFDALGNPLGRAIDSSFVQDQVLVRGRYVVTGKSTFNGEVGLTRLRFDSPLLAGFQGVLFGLTYAYDVSDVLVLNATLRRDLTSTLLAFSTPVDQLTFAAGANWRLTGRTSVGATFEARRLDFFADPSSASTGLGARTDELRTIGVTIGYELLRTLFLTGSLQRVERRSSLASFYASATIAAVSLEWRFR